MTQLNGYLGNGKVAESDCEKATELCDEVASLACNHLDEFGHVQYGTFVNLVRTFCVRFVDEAESFERKARSERVARVRARREKT